MRRNDREVTDFNEILGIIKKCDVCRLAINDQEYPYVIPLNFGVQVLDGKITLYFHGAAEGKKYDLLRKNNKVSFEMDCSHELVTNKLACGCTMKYESVIGQGTIGFVDGIDKIQALNIILEHYGVEKELNFNDATLLRTTVLKLAVSGLTAKKN
jgi:nitroimidazol reductase NimA-like FMN-containing flavoprotein (pyridoxamine 5'-phosphate oxidase superfamily)